MAKTNFIIGEIRNTASTKFNLRHLNTKEFDAVLKILVSVFSTVTDSRIKGMCTYSTDAILVSAFLAILCGANSWKQIAKFADSHIDKFHETTPIDDTYNSVFAKINSGQLQISVVSYMEAYINSVYNYVASGKGKRTKAILRQLCIDGQYLKHSGRSESAKKPTRMKGHIHVYETSLELTIDTLKVGPKTNEIPVVKNYVWNKDLTNYIISFDALHAQKETLCAIVDPKYRTGKYKKCTGNYVVGVKENQPYLFEAFDRTFTTKKIQNLEASEGSYYIDIDTNRHTIRKYYIVPAPCGKDEWAGLKSFVYCDSTTPKTHEIRYYITSLDDIEMIAECIRNHWWVENKVHYVFDTVYMQDSNTSMNENAILCKSVLFSFTDSLITVRNAACAYNDSRNTFRQACDLDVDNKMLGECFLDIHKADATASTGVAA